jgi:3-methyladenine DNA glycosylase/8-oxoguanine DNA glycosylase
MAIRRLPIEGALDLRRTLRPLGLSWSRFDADGWWRALRTPDGPATLRIWREADSVCAEAWGPGRAWPIERLDRWAGAHDTAYEWVADHAAVASLQRRRPGIRFGRTDLVFETVMDTVINQKVTGKEAAAGLRHMTRRFSQPAPGPVSGLWLPPPAEALAEAAYHDFHDLGIEKKRADTVRRLAADASRIDRLADVDPSTAMRALARYRGVGEWTVNETLVISHGYTDAVSVGDYHLKHIVSWHLAGREKGTDEEMLRLLEPFRPHRARVVRVLESVGGPQRKGPRMTVRGFQGF